MRKPVEFLGTLSLDGKDVDYAIRLRGFIPYGTKDEDIRSYSEVEEEVLTHLFPLQKLNVIRGK